MKPTAVLDIGSSKVVCLVGNIAERDGIIVHGVGIAACEPYLNGEFTDKQGLHDAIIDVIQKAEQESHTRIREIVLTVPTGFLELELSDVTMSFGDRARVVENDDVDQLIAKSFKKVSKPEDCILIHSTPVFFLVDGISSAEIPVGIETEEISALIAHIFVKKVFLDTIQDMLEDIGVEISMCISSMLGEALMLIPDQERVRPAVLIDVGYRQTDICVMEGSALTALSSIPMGGYQFASDLAFGLEVTQESAEQAKRRFVFSLDYGDKTEILRTETESKRVANSTIAYVIEARANELAELIRDQLEQMNVNIEAKPVVYLSGGGLLMMRGSLEFLKKKLNLAIKRDMPWTPRLSSPNYCSSFGALYFVLRANRPAEETPQKPERDEDSFLNKLKNFFTK
ncbi:MAG: cell division FtsA domain-containing protein [Clostridia bacterium]|nr:cell division FtsA domain-containing protein [Clostridia bacterium]